MADGPGSTVRAQTIHGGTDSLTALPPGTRLGKYQIIGVLGQGGFGITYRANDLQLDREVAIKEYLPAYFAVRQSDLMVLPRSTQLAEDFRWGRERFLAEARTLARFEKAVGIVSVYDFLESNGTAYMVMGLVRGETLETRIKRDGRLPQATIERLLHPLLDGLEKVHAASFLHRDIKPANILIDEDGEPTLIDFGASRVALQGRTQAMTAIYTPGYAAFEQFTSAIQGTWTDIYALGATLYHCITGAPPPSASDRMIDDTLVKATEAGKGRYTQSLLAAVDLALKLKAGDRPQTIADLRKLLSADTPSTVAEPEVAVTRRMDGPATGSEKNIDVRRRRWPAWLSAAVVTLLIAAAGTAGIQVWQGMKDRAEPQQGADRFPATPEATRRDQQRVRAAEEARRKAEVEADRRSEEERQRIEAEKTQAAAEAQRAQALSAEEALRLSLEQRRRAQLGLTSLGYDTKGSDGIFGERTRQMIAAWQRDRNEAATGFLTQAQYTALDAALAHRVRPQGDRQFVAYFNFDQAAVIPEAAEIVRSVARQYKTDRSSRLTVVGHTDHKERANLSIKRANAIKDMLVREGVPPSVIAVVGRGSEDPQSTGSDESAWALNRRVSIVMY